MAQNIGHVIFRHSPIQLFYRNKGLSDQRGQVVKDADEQPVGCCAASNRARSLFQRKLTFKYRQSIEKFLELGRKQ